MQGQQPIAVAVEAGNVSMLKVLLDAGASIDSVDKDVSSMHSCPLNRRSSL
jgi:ankyrin repeat protein